MIPLTDGIPPAVRDRQLRAHPANFAVSIFYEVPHRSSSVFHASFYACTVDGACHGPEPVRGARLASAPGA